MCMFNVCCTIKRLKANVKCRMAKGKGQIQLWLLPHNCSQFFNKLKIYEYENENEKEPANTVRRSKMMMIYGHYFLKILQQ